MQGQQNERIRQSSGFTMLEVLVVLVLISLMTALVMQGLTVR